jgi:CRP-like cAMP-binding protein
MDDTQHGREQTLDARLSGDGAGSAHDVADAVRHAGVRAAHDAEHNWLLRSLSVEDYGWLTPQLTPVRLRLKQVLIEPNEPIPYVWFVREGVASLIATEQEGGDVEVGTAGNEGLVGIPVLLNDDTMANRVMVQVEGEAWRISADTLKRVLDERPSFRKICLRYAAYFMTELSQSVACNRLHTLEERAARWLLLTHDRVHGNSFEMTHEFLALMLGVRRAGVSVAMGMLQAAGALRYQRGRVEVLDRALLEETSCDCYKITRSNLERLFGPQVRR